MLERLRQMFVPFGRLGLSVILLLAAYFALAGNGTGGLLQSGVFLALAMCGTWLALRLFRLAYRYLTWRLRHRLLVTYLFIAVVPITLIVALSLVSGYFLMSQLAVYLVTNELDHRITALAQTGAELARVVPGRWADVAPHLLDANTGGVAGTEVLVRSGGRILRYPSASKLDPPPPGSASAQGVVLRDGQPHLWSYQKAGPADLTIVQPLTREVLSGLVPNLGVVDFAAPPPGRSDLLRIAGESSATPRSLPAPANPFDREVAWITTVPVTPWGSESESPGSLVIGVRSRLWTVARTLFYRSGDLAQGVVITILAFLAGVFLIVELISLIAGATMTRTITRAVHHLYEGTQRVTSEDFSHRIEVSGGDQLAELGHSFNRMTENVERLLGVAKEKERLQSEMDIAREVQQHLFPRAVPAAKTLHVAALCQAARVVSGDYYDYAKVGDTQIALALGDVAGKGIAAALLMASLQSALRSELQGGRELSTSGIVGRLNRQLYENTAPEKYATFCLAIYDDALGVLSYTNAGHLPPILIRDGKAQRLDVNGTVVGAFPVAKYEESYLALEPGDLLVFFTDGVTEPENQFGEMFGEERLVDVVLRNSQRSGEDILNAIAGAVREWTGAGELQDDLTLLLARRVA
jgi:phosphoserine phosphatase RsbU/P